MYELWGIDCIDTDDYGESKKNIMISRSFGKSTHRLFDVEEAVRVYVMRVAEKLRKQSSLARAIIVFLRTNKHCTDLPQYFLLITVQLPYPSSDSRVIVQAANDALKAI